MIRILEFVMVCICLSRLIADHGSNDLALSKRGTVVNCDNADGVICIFDDHRAESAALRNDFCHAADGIAFLPAEGQRVNAFFRDDDELHQVERVGAFTQDAALRTALSAVLEKAFHILKILHHVIRGQTPARGPIACRHAQRHSQFCPEKWSPKASYGQRIESA